MINFRF